LNKLAASGDPDVGGLLFYSTAFFPKWETETAGSMHVSAVHRKDLAETKVPNAVTSVLADYRGYDTMFETSVIFTAGIAVMMLLRRPS